MRVRPVRKEPGERRGSIAELAAWAAAELAATSETPKLDAELLLAAATGASRAAVIAHPERSVAAEQAARFEDAVRRRARGEPLAYIVGTREFYSLPLRVSAGVLVPRAATEVLVEEALGRIAPGARASVLDLGTGSGAVALAIKRERPGLRVTAVDCDPAALAVARENAALLKLELRLLESDWFAGLEGERFDLIVGNPPYIPSADPHFDGPLRFESRRALDGGADGLAALRAILAGAPAHLNAGALLLLEHGYDQREAVIALAVTAGFEVRALRDDLAGQPRAVVLGVA